MIDSDFGRAVVGGLVFGNGFVWIVDTQRGALFDLNLVCRFNRSTNGLHRSSFRGDAQFVCWFCFDRCVCCFVGLISSSVLRQFRQLSNDCLECPFATGDGFGCHQRQLILQVVGQFCDRFFVHFVQTPDPAERFSLQFRIECWQYIRSLFGRDGCQHKCDRLWVFTLQQFKQRIGGRVFQERKR